MQCHEPSSPATNHMILNTLNTCSYCCRRALVFCISINKAAIFSLHLELFLKPCTHGSDLHIRKFCIYANFAYVSKSIFCFAFTWLFKISRICQKLRFNSIKMIIFLPTHSMLNLLLRNGLCHLDESNLIYGVSGVIFHFDFIFQ